VTRLTLVPPYSVADALAVLRGSGRYDPMYDDHHMPEIERAHAQWVSARLELDDLRLFAEHRGRVSARDIASVDMPRVIATARRELAERADRIAMLAEFKIPG
jgi:hypothetical protein